MVVGFYDAVERPPAPDIQFECWKREEKRTCPEKMNVKGVTLDFYEYCRVGTVEPRRKRQQ
jgi:hypothetical protein